MPVMAILFFIMESTDNLQGVDMNDDYTLVYKDVDNVLKDLVFANDDERMLCKVIVECLELYASKQFNKNRHIVEIPFTGKVHRNDIRDYMLRHYKDLADARKNMSKEDYDVYKNKLIKQGYLESKRKESERIVKRRDGNKTYKEFIKICKVKGVVFANAYIKFHKKMKYIEVDEDLNQAYVESFNS